MFALWSSGSCVLNSFPTETPLLRSCSFATNRPNTRVPARSKNRAKRLSHLGQIPTLPSPLSKNQSCIAHTGIPNQGAFSLVRTLIMNNCKRSALSSRAASCSIVQLKTGFLQDASIPTVHIFTSLILLRALSIETVQGPQHRHD